MKLPVNPHMQRLARHVVLVIPLFFLSRHLDKIGQSDWAMILKGMCVCLIAVPLWRMVKERAAKKTRSR